MFLLVKSKVVKYVKNIDNTHPKKEVRLSG